jgi:hypothetical protein
MSECEDTNDTVYDLLCKGIIRIGIENGKDGILEAADVLGNGLSSLLVFSSSVPDKQKPASKRRFNEMLDDTVRRWAEEHGCLKA